MLQVPEAASQIWKEIPFRTVEEPALKVNVQVVAVFPAEVPKASEREVKLAAKTRIGSI